MKDTVLIAIIGTISAIIVATLSSIITYIVARYNFRTPKTRNILEEQYIKILVPLHKLIYMETGNIHDKIEKSLEILLKGYEYVPIKIIKDLQRLRKNEDKDKFYEYAQNIHIMFLLVRKKLGYVFKQSEVDMSPYLTSKGGGSNDDDGTTSKGPEIRILEEALKINLKNKRKKILRHKEIKKVKPDLPIGKMKISCPFEETKY